MIIKILYGEIFLNNSNVRLLRAKNAADGNYSCCSPFNSFMVIRAANFGTKTISRSPITRIVFIYFLKFCTFIFSFPADLASLKEKIGQILTLNQVNWWSNLKRVSAPLKCYDLLTKPPKIKNECRKWQRWSSSHHLLCFSTSSLFLGSYEKTKKYLIFLLILVFWIPHVR